MLRKLSVLVVSLIMMFLALFASATRSEAKAPLGSKQVELLPGIPVKHVEGSGFSYTCNNYRIR